MISAHRARTTIFLLLAITAVSCSKKKVVSAEPDAAPEALPGMLVVPLDGFARVCPPSAPIVRVLQNDGGMRAANQALAGKYYVDGVFHQPGACDVIGGCEHVSSSNVDLHDYAFEHNQLDPGGLSYSPAFHATALTGTIDISISYYADPTCAVSKQFHRVITR